jgi:stage V sporulation protein G
MQITDVRIRKIIDDKGRLLGVASITISESIVIHDIKIVQGDERRFVAMPSRRNEFDETTSQTEQGRKNQFRDICHPITKEARTMIENAVLNAYDIAYELQAQERVSDTDECRDIGLSLESILLHTPDAYETDHSPTDEV